MYTQLHIYIYKSIRVSVYCLLLLECTHSPGQIEADGTSIRSWKGRCGWTGDCRWLYLRKKNLILLHKKIHYRLRSIMFRIKSGLKMDTEFHISALTLLVLLRVGDVKFPPLLSTWSHVSTTEMEDLHEVACLSKHKDNNAIHVMKMMQSCYDWHTLTRATPVLKQEWRFFGQRHIPLPVAVLAKVEVLNRRWQGPSQAFFDDTQGWDERCWQALESLACQENPHTSLLEETEVVVSHLHQEPDDAAICLSPPRPRKESTAVTPVQTYLDYIEVGGPPSPVSCHDSPPSRRFKDWYRKQVEEEQSFIHIHTMSDDDASELPHEDPDDLYVRTAEILSCEHDVPDFVPPLDPPSLHEDVGSSDTEMVADKTQEEEDWSSVGGDESPTHLRAKFDLKPHVELQYSAFRTTYIQAPRSCIYVF